ncbi:hypothetical protein Bhyg_07149 [Pseudolycoriella hygida]|uniref:Uncharacterized protein n=1 Tax=Pseudolycoriella hygida TaxID=35572 RepID=A0A9Q0N255_9DIPT|nr:hypothetical protein Bhyg_07149 [Pseudolycoriella hygida]
MRQNTELNVSKKPYPLAFATGQFRSVPKYYSFMDASHSHIPVSYNPHSTFGSDVFYPPNQVGDPKLFLLPQEMKPHMSPDLKSEMESDLHEIMALMSAENYVVQELSQDGFQNRFYLYKRIKKWMVDLSLRRSIIKKFNESLHLQYVKERKREPHSDDQLNKSGFIFCCPVCIEAVKIADTTKHRKNGRDVQYYSVSNVVRHLQKLHSNQSTEERFVGNSKKMKRKRIIAESSESSGPE